ncbi:MAG: L-histidine N(alpha)-methyltransferase [Pyrinomonadaceae bacterium]
MAHAAIIDTQRLTLHRLVAHDPTVSFAADIARGLAGTPKELSPKYFYDALGSLLFDAICLVPEYYLTRAENEILARFANEIVASVGSDGKLFSLLEAGSGNATKTRRIIEAILARQSSLQYTPIDISASALEQSAHVLLDFYPSLRVDAYASDYETALSHLNSARGNSKPNTRTFALFLGSNIGNFAPSEAEKFLRALRGALRAGNALLLGTDLKKDPKILQAAYNDALGVTAAFNLNLLTRINRELNADFNPRAFRHIALYNERTGAIESYLESLSAQTINIRALDMQVNFAAGERMHTENSHKYNLEDISQLASRTGFVRARTWLDHCEQFSSNLLIATEQSADHA